MAAGSNRNRNDIKRGFSNKPETTIKRQTTDFIRARKQLYIYIQGRFWPLDIIIQLFKDTCIFEAPNDTGET